MDERKLKNLAESEGTDVEGLLKTAITDSVVPGICAASECSYTVGVEPDSRSGWCEVCETGTVVSCLVLAGII